MHYAWKDRREKRAVLAFEDGTLFKGYSAGAEIDRVGEIVFNTGMTGYQEILTDPSYAGQFVTMTCPEIGNTGINDSDPESKRFYLNGFIVNEINQPSNWRSEESLTDSLKYGNIPCIAGIDTRAVATIIRKKGCMKAFMHCSNEPIPDDDCVKKAKEWIGLDNQDYAIKVSTTEPYEWDPNNNKTISWGMTHSIPKSCMHIAAYDFGIKWNILRSMKIHGMKVTVVPANTESDKILKLKPDGLFLSNGPADPAAVGYAVNSVRELIGKLPIMGICLGHQILSIACGAERFKLKFGHHGCNHPVKNLQTGKIEITSQNHNFAIDADSLKNTKLELTHINLNDKSVEGIRHKNEPMFAVQYHPEASPGPHDSSYLFEEFKKLIMT